MSSQVIGTKNQNQTELETFRSDDAQRDFNRRSDGCDLEPLGFKGISGIHQSQRSLLISNRQGKPAEILFSEWQLGRTALGTRKFGTDTEPQLDDGSPVSSTGHSKSTQAKLPKTTLFSPS